MEQSAIIITTITCLPAVAFIAAIVELEIRNWWRRRNGQYENYV